MPRQEQLEPPEQVRRQPEREPLAQLARVREQVQLEPALEQVQLQPARLREQALRRLREQPVPVRLVRLQPVLEPGQLELVRPEPEPAESPLLESARWRWAHRSWPRRRSVDRLPPAEPDPQRSS